MRAWSKRKALGHFVPFSSVAIALLLGGAASASTVAVPSFSKQRTYATGSSSNGGLTGIADLNGDGFPDLVALHKRQFAVLLNTGHGTFGGKRDYQTGQGRTGVIGDMNGDGRPDLVSADVGGTVSVLLNRGDGSFAARRAFPIGADPSTLAVADVNGDGRADVVTANSGTLSVLMGNGDGTLQAHRDYSVGTEPLSRLLVADLNGDGKPDLVTGSSADVSVSVLLGNGDGTFQPPREHPTAPGYSNSLAVADMNGDGKPDIVTAEFCGGCQPGQVTVLFNAGEGRFTRRNYALRGGIIPLFGGPVSAAVADVNGDGRPDIVTTDMGNLDHDQVGISVLLNRGDGTFARTDHPVGGLESSVAIGDVNGDRSPDIVMTDAATSASSMVLLVNKGDGFFQPRRDYRIPSLLSRVAISDLNGDGRTDLVGETPGAVSVLLNTPGLCDVPDVRSLTRVGARARLARVNCRVGKLRSRYDPRVKKGRIVSQAPKFGAVLPAGGKVDLIVSKGRKGS